MTAASAKNHPSAEMVATYARSNPGRDGVNVYAEMNDGRCRPVRTVLIAAVPELRAMHKCPPQISDLKFLVLEIDKPSALKKAGIRRFYMEYEEMNKDKPTASNTPSK
jgi:hypothetical protein